MWFYVLPVKNRIGYLEKAQCVTHTKTWNNQTSSNVVVAQAGEVMCDRAQQDLTVITTLSLLLNVQKQI
jgi:hypothetical protein